MNKPDHPLFDNRVIEEILPHRTPFLFVDRVTDFEGDKQIIAEKDLCLDAPFFAGHFPGNPIMPGVLVSEALAQTSGLLLGLTWREKGHRTKNERQQLFLAMANMKYTNTARPGETVVLEAHFKKHYGGLFLFDVAAYVLSKEIARGTLALSLEKAI